eukprot:TRINITY_DN2508_c0_g1_i1.p1 TRINITY_DN2508_c0_g1~~TRINITY_DN2508_c0_g1_i1.p1  ORF type:complete len:298 (-),score=53.41 TRINITY_DN2508_c0_g1_i1:308-1096(-)
MAFLRFASVFLLFSLLLTSPLLQVVKSQDINPSDDVAGEDKDEVGIVGDGIQEFENSVFGPASGVETVYFFLKNSEKVIPAGYETDMLVGLNNQGESPLMVHSIRASLHLPFDHKYLVQNLTVQEFVNATVPPSVQATFPYSFTVNKYLQPGLFSLVGSVWYEVDEQLHQSVFYNGTIEVVEAMGFLNGETLSLVALGTALLGLSGLWIYGQIQRFSKKNKKTKKVEVGTRSVDLSNEWLQGTAFAQSLKTMNQTQKSKKKK